MKTNKVFKTALSLALAMVMTLAAVLVDVAPADAAKAPALNKTSVTMKVGDAAKKVVVNNYVAGSTYVWSSSNSKVATVTADSAKPIKAMIKAVKAGSTTVTCKMTTEAGKKYSLKTKVTVQALPTGLSLKADKTSIAVKATAKITATVKPAGAYAKLTYKSNKTGVAKVDSKGTVTGVKKGTATITVTTSNGKKATIKIKVTADAAGKVIWDQNKDGDGAITKTYDSYKYHVSAIWLTPVNLFYAGGDKDVGKAVNYLGKKFHVTGEFKMAGPETKKVIAQLNYTMPDTYPVVWECGTVKTNQTVKVDMTFTLPTNAKNGDKDSETGINWPILLYFANKPDNKMIYNKGNDFTFKNFKFAVMD